MIELIATRLEETYRLDPLSGSDFDGVPKPDGRGSIVNFGLQMRATYQKDEWKEQRVETLTLWACPHKNLQIPMVALYSPIELATQLAEGREEEKKWRLVREKCYPDFDRALGPESYPQQLLDDLMRLPEYVKALLRDAPRKQGS